MTILSTLILICLLFSSTLAQENHYRKAECDLQRVYEHFEGISLEKAIDRLIAKKRDESRVCGNESANQPDAPLVCFKLAEPRCEFAGKSSNPNIIYIPDHNCPVKISFYNFCPHPNN